MDFYGRTSRQTQLSRLNVFAYTSHENGHEPLKKIQEIWKCIYSCPLNKQLPIKQNGVVS